MLKKNKTVLYIAIGLALLYFLKNRKNKFNAMYEQGQEAEATAQDDYFTGGGGSGFQPTGEDSTTSLGGDPASSVQTSKPSTGGGTPLPTTFNSRPTVSMSGGKNPTSATRPTMPSGNTAPIVGDIASGGSGRPAVGRPTAPTVSVRRNGNRPTIGLTR